MHRLMKNKKAEGYIDICVGVVALLCVLVLTINIYSFLTLKQDLDEISEQLIQVATYNGCFSDAFNQRANDLKTQFFDFDYTASASSYYNAALKKVQLGQKMTVTVSVQTRLVGVGVVSVPITCTSTRSGISEKYWKG